MQSESEVVANFAPDVHIDHPSSVEMADENVENVIHEETIPLECMLPEKLFQNEDSSDSIQTNPNCIDIQLASQSLLMAQTMELDTDHLSQQQPENEDPKVKTADLDALQSRFMCFFFLPLRCFNLHRTFVMNQLPKRI